MDVMYNSLQELENGKNFFVVELNGAASEPTHIYDQKLVFFCMERMAQHITYV
jgi:Tol biopolymer transport system component